MCCTSCKGDKVKSGSQKVHAFAGLFPEALHTDCISALMDEIGDEAQNLRTSRFDMLARRSPLQDFSRRDASEDDSAIHAHGLG